MKKLVSLSLLFSMFALASGPKIGVVDLQKALQETKRGKGAKENLEKEMAAKRTGFEKKQGELEKERAALEGKAKVMDAKKRDEEGAKLQKKFMEFQQEVNAAQQDIGKKEAELTRPLIEGLRAMLGDVARKKDLDFVIDSNALLYAVDRVDITEQLIKMFDEKNP